MHSERIPDGRQEAVFPEHEHFLFEGIDYPASKEELVDFATDAEADPDTLNLIRSMPDHQYASRDDIWRSVGEATRVLAGGGRNIGTPRDDIGKEVVFTKRGPRYP